MPDSVPDSLPLCKSAFDAALTPGIRDAMRAEYRALDSAWQKTASGMLGPDGEFLPGTARERDCPLCGAPSISAELRFRKLGMHIVSCSACGMTYSRQVLH